MVNGNRINVLVFYKSMPDFRYKSKLGLSSIFFFRVLRKMSGLVEVLLLYFPGFLMLCDTDKVSHIFLMVIIFIPNWLHITTKYLKLPYKKALGGGGGGGVVA